jgi:hypothetical protein
MVAHLSVTPPAKPRPALRIVASNETPTQGIETIDKTTKDIDKRLG